MNSNKVKHCVKTCDCCPSQWDIYTYGGQYYYARYRFGRFTLTLDPFRDSQQTVIALEIGDEYDGVMSTSQMQQLTKDVLDW